MITVNHYQNDEWSVTGIPLDRNILANSLYHYGHASPNYPVPAIRAMVNNAQRLIQFGEITAENGFDLQTVFERYVKLR